ncbi:type VI secretion system Vgr family protein [Paraburkholderia bannensis]|uniref:type VI secretion system Vgr family protein n=1 Tax=Paraburkholderia bannensis TaxID=765414 RepID=UPI002AB073E4|nr:type VI secretion system tip protein TssI/VgrG [Paraburkholderia bannensis]
MTGAQWQMLGMRGPALPEQLALTPRRIVGREGIGELFEYRVQACARASLAPGFFDEDERTKIDLDRIVGTPVWLTIDLERVDCVGRSGSARSRRGVTTTSTGAGTRHINGIVASACVLGGDGHDVVYEFVVRPSFWLAALKQDSRFFSGAIVDILHDVIGSYGQIEWRINSAAYPQRDYIRQAWESDWHFFLRLCEEWGFVVWFEHREQEHVLVIADNANAYRKHERAYETLRYHTGGGHIDEEHISELVLCSAVTPGVVTVQDHSYIQPRLNRYSTPFRAQHYQPRNTANAQQEVFARADFALPKTRRDAPYDESNWEADAREFARIKLEALRASGLRARAHGALRGIEAGKTLTLAHYPHPPANGAYLVIGCEMDICATGATSSSTREYAITTSFDMQPLHEPYRMPQVTPRPNIGGYEYAVIVGPDNAEMFVDEYNRALVQFDWDRKGEYDGRSAIWVRLATQWQGNGMGTVTHARCGQPVLVGYVHGDPDRPVIAGFAVDENNRPPWKMPANQALSGIVSKSLGLGTPSNHLALDDTQDRMQAQLASDHGKSSLSIGYITRIDGHEGRQDARGEGFELRTDKQGAIRAALGLLLTTWGRQRAAGKVKEMGETIGQLTAARDLHEGLAAQAQRHGAQQALAEQSEVVGEIKEAIARLKGKPAQSADAFPEFEQPDIALSSAANLHMAAAASAHIASERHTALTTGGHVSIAAGKSLFASVREKIAFYAQKAVTVISPGPVRIESRNESMTLAAQDNLSISSANGIVRIAGRDGVDIVCGGTLLRLRPEGLTGYTGGNFLLHAANHGTNDPQAMPVDFPVTVDNPGKFAAHHVLVEEGDGFALPEQPYRLTLDDGQVISGVTNHLGELQPVTSNAVVFGMIELMAQSEPDNVIAMTHLTISRDAALPPSAALDVPARQTQVSGQTVKTPVTGATSEGKAPDYLSCDAENFGLRSYRYLGNSKEEPVSIHTRNDVEYFVAKPYTAAVKEKLTAINWGAVVDLPFDQSFAVIVDAVSAALEVALETGPFGLKKTALPQVLIASEDKLVELNLHPKTTLAVFSADQWAMLIARPYLERILLIAKRKLEADKKRIAEFPANAMQDTLCGLAMTVYHEARHCQQTFWMASLYCSYPDDYSQYGGMEPMFELVIAANKWQIAQVTPFPDDFRVKVGMHRMLIFYYWWRVIYLKDSPGLELLKADFEKIQKAICEMRGATPEQVRQMAIHESGYYTHYHEEDAYATENAVGQYWHDPEHSFVLNPGVCTRYYEQNLRRIGVKGNG